MVDPSLISAIVMGAISVIGAVSLFFNRLHIKKCIACCCDCECANSNPPSRNNSKQSSPIRITFPSNSTTSL